MGGRGGGGGVGVRGVKPTQALKELTAHWRHMITHKEIFQVYNNSGNDNRSEDDENGDNHGIVLTMTMSMIT